MTDLELIKKECMNHMYCSYLDDVCHFYNRIYDKCMFGIVYASPDIWDTDLMQRTLEEIRKEDLKNGDNS